MHLYNLIRHSRSNRGANQSIGKKRHNFSETNEIFSNEEEELSQALVFLYLFQIRKL